MFKSSKQMDAKLHKFEFYLFIERLSAARSKRN